MQAAPDAEKQIVRTDGLSENTGDVETAEIGGRSGHDDDGDVARGGMRGDFPLHRQSAEHRQTEVEHDEFGQTLIESAKRFYAIAGFFDIEPVQAERQL